MVNPFIMQSKLNKTIGLMPQQWFSLCDMIPKTIIFKKNPIFSHHKYPHLIILLATLFLSSSLLLFQINEAYIIEWNLVTINSASISFPILLEGGAILFIFTVSFISFNVLLFSKVYIRGDINLHRFTQIVILFIASILILIICPNTIIILLGWDGLGITRFLLVIYYQNPRSLKSGLITLATNRIGDCLILFSIAIIMSQGQWNIINIWRESIFFTSLLSLLILVATITKRAQFPFIAWLTCAIAAPTPVSALVHSSTLVTAGVFLLIRFYNFLAEFYYFSSILIWAGTVTIFTSAAWAMTKKDIKETIALSTISQLGLIITTLRLGITNLCFFHLLTHAMFKATIFIAAGIAITFKGHRQDFKNINIKLHSRTSAIAIVTRLISINAMFFIAGYYSKDSILEIIWYNPRMYVWIILFFMSTAITATYSIRLWRGIVTNKIYSKAFFRGRTPHHNIKTHLMSNNFTIVETPIIIITFISTTIGRVSGWLTITPRDTPIVPQELESLAPLAVVSGVLLALYFNPSNKSKGFDSEISKRYSLDTPVELKRKEKDFFTKWSYAKILLYTFTPTVPYKYKKKVTHTLVTNMLTLKYPCNRPTIEFINTTYKTAKPFIFFSHSLEKTLDRGSYKLLGPSLIASVIPNSSPSILKFQTRTINQILTAIVVISFLALPLIIYDNLQHNHYLYIYLCISSNSLLHFIRTKNFRLYTNS